MLEHEITSEILLRILYVLAPLVAIPLVRDKQCHHISGSCSSGLRLVTASHALSVSALLPHFRSFYGCKADFRTVIGHVSTLLSAISFAYRNGIVNQNRLLVCHREEGEFI
jgi:hypothetical protein